ncbi:MAG: polynucleotide adenylyltransferase PcnB [Methylococcales bacterium]|jgi:poly(A) polymerase|nr:polynucleotide adenylyltransferase PcnB [Methylococcales bacterium]MBT7408171.1 polynucleotide adenylyltransferase PcnB [Methylococcales bacterium]
MSDLPAIIARPNHCISRSGMSKHAVKVLYRLHNLNHQAFLVGGAVRDLLLGFKPKDFDIATNAHPEQVKEAFRNCRIIGRRFRLAHVCFGDEMIEVATFRSGHDEPEDVQQTEHGRLLYDNVYGTLEEDVWRRDFTVNALYYNIADFSVLDYTGGIKDLENKSLRLIGDPEQRYREDPVRMLRAIRLSVKLDFEIESTTQQPITELGYLLSGIPAARLLDEMNKMFLTGYATDNFYQLKKYDLFKYLFPETNQCLSDDETGLLQPFVEQAMQNTDSRVRENKPVMPAFLIATLLWRPLTIKARFNLEQGMTPYEAEQRAMTSVIKEQAQATSIPKRFVQSIREIWSLQRNFHSKRGMRPYKLLAHKRFRAAYDFLILRVNMNEIDQSLVDWWTTFQEVDEVTQRKMTQPQKKNKKPKKQQVDNETSA